MNRCQPFQVRTGCGHIVIRKMREATAGVPYTPETVIEAPGGMPCEACCTRAQVEAENRIASDTFIRTFEAYEANPTKENLKARDDAYEANNQVVAKLGKLSGFDRLDAQPRDPQRMKTPVNQGVRVSSWTVPDLEWRFGCRLCGAVHESESLTTYPETIRVVRKIVLNKDSTLKSVESEYECLTHPIS